MRLDATPEPSATPAHPSEAPAVLDPVARLERWRTANRIVGIYEEEITKEIRGRTVTRHGTAQDPAVLVEGRNGILQLRLASELDVL
ncbi:MAG: hypothetical protein ACLF0P_02890 [Thermoanaerobaculia bacterium]